MIENATKQRLIKITGTQLVNGEEDIVEVTTAGDFYLKDKSYYILYDESEATGFQGSKTIVKYEPQCHSVTMSRTGKHPSQLIVEEQRRHQCSYETGEGCLTIGISGKEIVSTLTEAGGTISFQYDLDIETTLVSENGVTIQIMDSDTK